jgi:hypothetical protein
MSLPAGRQGKRSRWPFFSNLQMVRDRGGKIHGKEKDTKKEKDTG